MDDRRKTKQQLIDEVQRLRQRLAGLATLEAERRQTLETLRDTEQYYHDLLENASILIQSVALDGHFLFVNGAWRETLGYTTDEVARLTLMDVVAPECLADCMAKFQQVMTGGTVMNIETTFIAKDGRRIALDGSANCRMVEGQPMATRGLFRNITERKRIEQALRESEERYRSLYAAAQRQAQELALLDQARTALARELDLPSVIRTVVEAIAHTFGYTQVSLYLLRGNVLVLQHQVGYDTIIAQIHISQGISGRVARSGQPVLLQNVGSDPEFLAAIDNIVSEVCTPLFDQGQVVGVLNVESTAGVPLTDVDLRLMIALSEHVSIAIGHARLYAQTQQELAERQRAEAELRQLKDFNAGIVETMTEGIVIEDLEGRYTFMNPAASALLGYTAEELLGGHWTTVIPSDQQPLVEAANRRRARGETDHYELDAVRKDGARISLLVSGSPWFEEGRFAGSLVVFADITQRKRAEETLAHHALQMAALYETSLEINSQPNVPALLRAIVRRATELLGVPMAGLYLMQPDGETLELVVNQNVSQAYTGIRLRLGEGVSGRVAQSGQPLMVEDYRVWEGRSPAYPDPEFRAVLGVPLKSGDRVIGVISVDDDRPRRFSDEDIQLVSLFADQAAIAVENARLHEQLRRHAEELEQRVVERTRELQAANERLTELDRLKDEFVSRISHELRTPLTSIRIYHELLEHGTPEKYPGYLRILDQETARLHKLIEDLLKISQLNTEVRAVNLGPIDLNRVATDLIDHHATLAAQHGLRLAAALEPDLPSARADEDWLWQIMMNLMTNALNYTQHGEVTISTQRHVRADEQWITIAVRDTGPGLTPDDRAHLFERFYRGHAARDYKTPGAGLGLSISQQLAGKLGGRVTVDSVEGQGSTFTVWLPAAGII